jgi:hypothetical protein
MDRSAILHQIAYRKGKPQNSRNISAFLGVAVLFKMVIAMRQPIRKEIQVEVFRRDRWLCRWCGCPVIFAPVMRYLAEFVKQEGCKDAPAYYNRNWRRRDAPLLDHMGAVIDHVEAHSGRKSASTADAFAKRRPRIPVKGKYGDPLDWDGLSNLFMILVSKNPGIATSTERTWLRALKRAPGSGTQI